MSEFNHFCEVVLDLKGKQYSGELLPGPCALILETDNTTYLGNDDSVDLEPTYLRVINFTDEFVQCERIESALDRLSAAFEQGDSLLASSNTLLEDSSSTAV